MKKPTFTVRQLTACAIVAALYAVITIASGPLAYDLMQFRLSEALIVLCWFEPVLGVGVTLGCFKSTHLNYDFFLVFFQCSVITKNFFRFSYYLC